VITQSIATQIRAIITASEQVGAKLPPAVVEAYDRTTRHSQKAAAIYPPAGALAAAVVAALDADRDPAADPTVQRLLAAQQLGGSDRGAVRGVQSLLEQQLQDVCRAQAGAIVKAWRRPFDAAAATLVKAHERLGDIDLDDTGTVVQQGGDAAAVWASARAALSAIAQINDAWFSLAQLTRFASDNPHLAALRITSASPEQYAAWVDDKRGRRAGAWEMVAAGLPLSLADGSEFARRCSAIEAQRVQAEAMSFAASRRRGVGATA
jgi:hypothetical protein